MASEQPAHRFMGACIHFCAGPADLQTDVHEEPKDHHCIILHTCGLCVVVAHTRAGADALQKAAMTIIVSKLMHLVIVWLLHTCANADAH